MKENFPQLWKFQNGDEFGFEGWLHIEGYRRYQIVVKAKQSTYPQERPRVYLEPHPEEHHWYRHEEEVFLCFDPKRGWNVNRSTFATCVASAVRYIKEFERETR